jgi:Bacterial TniB protein
MNLSDYAPPNDLQIKAMQEVQKTVVQHDAMSKILDDVVAMATMMQSIRSPSGILIQAEPGMGKTLILQLIRDEVNQRIKRGFGEQKTLSVNLDAAVDAVRMAGFFAHALGYTALPTSTRLERMNNMIETAMLRLEPVIATIDETQHICEGNRDITARSVTDWLKVRMDRFNFATICAGTLGLDRLSTINPQFTSRASANYILEPFQCDQSWLRLLDGFANSVKTVNMGLISQGAAKMLHTASKGNMRSLKRILTYAAESAALDPGQQMRMKDLMYAYNRHGGTAAYHSNPFRTV